MIFYIFISQCVSALAFSCQGGVKKLKIKKVDEKPMIIHTKKPLKLHRYTRKNLKQSIESQNHGNDLLALQEKTGKRKRRLQDQSGSKRESKLRRSMRESAGQLKHKKGSTIKTLAHTKMIHAFSQAEGGDESKSSLQIPETVYLGSKAIGQVVNQGKQLSKKKAEKEAEKRVIRKKERLKTVANSDLKRSISVQSRNKVDGNDKKNTKEREKRRIQNSKKGTESKQEIVRAKMLAVFLAKLKTSIKNKTATKTTNPVNDGLTAMVKQIAAFAGFFLLVLFLLIAVACLPVVLIVAVIYNSPFAMFFPALEDGDTLTTVASAYVADFNREVQSEADDHSGYDRGIIRYGDYEGNTAGYDNYFDILAVYMVKYGVGDTATIMNDTSKERLQAVVNDMCSYEVSYDTVTETEITLNEETGEYEETQVTYSVKVVDVTRKSYVDMAEIYGFSDDEVELLEACMDPTYLAALGYTPGGRIEYTGTLTEAEVDEILKDMPEGKQKQVCRFALSKVGYPYSQPFRDSGTAYDCSSLAHWAWMAAGVDITYNGYTNATNEAKGLYEAGRAVSYSEIQPGDLIFYSWGLSGGFMNIDHVAIYIGNGKSVEAANSRVGVIYGTVYRTDCIVMVGRPE